MGETCKFRCVPLRNMERTDASLSPTNLLRTSLGPMDIKAARASPAMARASCVCMHRGIRGTCENSSC